MQTQARVRPQPAAAAPAVRAAPAGLQWTRPAFEDLRFGFEITMYISNR
jgi:coenzyme PQQ precursor peptide PqqA